jgi:hypothetical protein
MKKTINVGLVKAIFSGVTPPSNIDVIWRDLSLENPIHKYFDSLSGSWEPLSSSDVKIDNVTIKKNQNGELYAVAGAVGESNFYRLGSFSINGITTVQFSQPELPTTDYSVFVLKYISGGIDSKSGYKIDTKTITNFKFTPSTRYQVGVLTYLLILNK